MMPKYRSFILDRDLLILFFTYKLFFVSTMLFFFYYYDVFHEINLWNRLYSGKGDLHSIYIPFSNWDGQHYLLLADKGYGFVQQSQGFFPFFPMLIKFFGCFTRNLYLSAFMVNFVFSYLFVVIFYNYAREYCTKENALKSVMLVLAYPSAIFLTVFYSEAVFLFLLFGFLYLYRKENYWSTVFSALMPFARAQTVFIFGALLIGLLWRILKKDKVNYVYEFINLLCMITGFLLYFIFMYLTTGSPFSGIEAQKRFVFGFSLVNSINPSHFVAYLFHGTEGLFSYNNSIIDKVFVILLLASIPLIIKSKDPVIICMFLVLAYFPASMGGGGGYLRHSLSAIPFLSIVLFSKFPKHRVVLGSISIIFLVWQVYCIFRFSLNMWVG